MQALGRTTFHPLCLVGREGWRRARAHCVPAVIQMFAERNIDTMDRARARARKDPRKGCASSWMSRADLPTSERWSDRSESAVRAAR